MGRADPDGDYLQGRCLRGLNRGPFAGRLAHYLGEVNALHPFRNVDASAAIMRGDPEPMREMLDALLRDDT